MRKLLQVAAVLGSVLAVAGCDTAKRLTSDQVMVGTFLTTPEREVTPRALTGSEAASGEPVRIPGQTSALITFGEFRTIEAAPAGIEGAEMELRSSVGDTQTLTSIGGGVYGKSNDTDGALRYTAGSTYTAVATYEGDTYEAEVKSVPEAEAIAQLTSDQGYVEHDANTVLTLQRPAAPSGQERNLGFVTVIPLSSDGQKGEPTYSSLPTSASDLLKLATSSGTYRRETVEIPATAFPSAATPYLVIFQSTKLGSAKSTNLQVATVLLAGNAQVGVVRTR